MRHIKKPLIRIINLIILVIFLLSGHVYSYNLRVPLDKEYSRIRQIIVNETLEEILLIRHNLLRFLEPEKILDYLKTVDSILCIDPKTIMSKAEALKLIKEGKASIARRVEDGERVVVLFSATKLIPKTDFISYKVVLDKYEEIKKERKYIDSAIDEIKENNLRRQVDFLADFMGDHGKETEKRVDGLIEIIKNPEDSNKAPAALAALELRARKSTAKYASRRLAALAAEERIDNRLSPLTVASLNKGENKNRLLYCALNKFGFILIDEEPKARNSITFDKGHGRKIKSRYDVRDNIIDDLRDIIENEGLAAAHPEVLERTNPVLLVAAQNLDIDPLKPPPRTKQPNLKPTQKTYSTKKSALKERDRRLRNLLPIDIASLTIGRYPDKDLARAFVEFNIETPKLLNITSIDKPEIVIIDMAYKDEKGKLVPVVLEKGGLVVGIVGHKKILDRYNKDRKGKPVTPEERLLYTKVMWLKEFMGVGKEKASIPELIKIIKSQAYSTKGSAALVALELQKAVFVMYKSGFLNQPSIEVESAI